jgi:serine phosphatase RsbU (regulator of sigma subunit)
VLSCVRDITERKRTERDLREKEIQLVAAQRIQQRLLPQSPPAPPGFDIAGAVYPAEYVAGDYFDFPPMRDDRIGFVIGDVTGHGFSSALLTSCTRSLIRSLAETGMDAGGILARANSALTRETEEHLFVTLLLGHLDPRERTFVHASAGHPPGYVLDGTGAVKSELESTGPPLAVVPDIDFATATPVALEPGDLVLLLTDGLLEAESPEGEVFESERALEVVRRHRHQSARGIIDALYDAVRRFAARPQLGDDLTVVVIKVAEDRGRPQAARRA